MLDTNVRKSTLSSVAKFHGNSWQITGVGQESLQPIKSLALGIDPLHPSNSNNLCENKPIIPPRKTTTFFRIVQTQASLSAHHLGHGDQLRQERDYAASAYLPQSLPTITPLKKRAKVLLEWHKDPEKHFQCREPEVQKHESMKHHVLIPMRCLLSLLLPKRITDCDGNSYEGTKKYSSPILRMLKLTTPAIITNLQK
ncbi:hypothetical protein P7K49_000625 [Saguinus oedipus]|uniref:Uncharacterized protein n=1 Tax=Saguinus oedipus TaxID=9490 RepID=A0ABQ9WC80_SAGOE|nr:hypothetical protein P7K49_000625 [Saguinus oedipus]